MRRWPKRGANEQPPPYSPLPGQGVPGTTADTRMDAIKPWLAAGGLPYFIINAGLGFDPRPAGYQICAWQYVPAGQVGFLKHVVVGPYCPPELADPWATVGALGPSWRVHTNFGSFFGTQRAQPTNGIYETPLAWQSYAVAGEVAIAPIEWEWLLTVVPGDIRKRQVPFDQTDPSTFPWQPNIPVPESAYANGIAGAPLGFGQMGWSPFQCIPRAPLAMQGIIPEDSTLVLFARWRQVQVTPRLQITDGTTSDYGPALYPLLPSYGQLLGYTQPTDSDAGESNALYGWGG